MTEKTQEAREQTESEDDFSLPSVLNKKTNYFEFNYNPSDNLDSDSDQNLDGDINSDNNHQNEASQYQLFRKPIEQLVNDNPSTTNNIEAQIHINILNSQIKDRILQQNQTHYDISSINQKEDEDGSQNDPNNKAVSISTQDNSFNSPMIRQNILIQRSPNSINKQVEQRQAFQKFRSHEVQIEHRAGGDNHSSNGGIDGVVNIGQYQFSNSSDQQNQSQAAYSQFIQENMGSSGSQGRMMDFHKSGIMLPKARSSEYQGFIEQRFGGNSLLLTPDYQSQQLGQFNQNQKFGYQQSPQKISQYADQQRLISYQQQQQQYQLPQPDQYSQFYQGQQFQQSQYPNQIGQYAPQYIQQNQIQSTQLKKDPGYYLVNQLLNRQGLQSSQNMIQQQFRSSQSSIEDQNQIRQIESASKGYITPQFQINVNQIEEQQKQLISGFEGIELNNQQPQQHHQLDSSTPQFLNDMTGINQFQQTGISQVPSSQPPPGFENIIPYAQQQKPQQSSDLSQISQSQAQTLQSQTQPLVKGGQNSQISGIGNSYALGVPQTQYPPLSSTTQSNNVLIDQSESILVKIMCNYEEASTQQLKLDALKDNVIKLAMNQTGSKFLQRLLDNANPQIVQFLLDEIQRMLPQVMIDNYGNYFCQRLLINCSSAQRMQILERIAGDIIEICENKKGTHAIQKFIDLVNLEAEEKFFQRVLKGHVAKLSFDVQGTHVIQNIIKCFEESKRQFVFEEIYESFVSLAMNNCGLCVIKIIIQKTVKQENRKKLMSKIVANAIELAQDPYGNYAIQQAFEHWDKEICQEMIPQFFGKIYQLSMQKCSSNVIDRCIQNSKQEYLSIIMQELINCERLNNLIMNSYGNFVVQNALRFATIDDRNKLSEQIEKNIPNISDPKIKQKWSQLLKKNNKSLADSKGVFKSQDSEGSESSLKSARKMNDYIGGNKPQDMKPKRLSNQNSMNPHPQQRPQIGGYNQILMPPPQPQINGQNFGMQSSYNNPNFTFQNQQQYMIQKQISPNQMMVNVNNPTGYMQFNPQGHYQNPQFNYQNFPYQGQSSQQYQSLMQQPGQQQQQQYQQNQQYDPLGLNDQNQTKRNQQDLRRY